MRIVRQQRRPGVQGTRCDNDIRQRQYAARAIELVSQPLRLLPDAMIHRHVDEEIEKSRQTRSNSWTNDSTKNFTAHDVATGDFRRCKPPGQLRHRIPPAAQQLDVNRRINEDHA